MLKERSNKPRIMMCTIMGFLFGIFSAWTSLMAFPDYYDFKILTSIIYNRTLMGFIIGISHPIRLSPVLRGPLLGIAVGLMLCFNVDALDALLFFSFSVPYGLVIDVMATKFAKNTT